MEMTDIEKEVFAEGVLSQMQEALILETLGAEIELCVKGSRFVPDNEDAFTQRLIFPTYPKGVILEIQFYLEQTMDLVDTCIFINGTPIVSSQEMKATLEEAYEWLIDNKRF